MLLKAIIRKQFHYEETSEIEALSRYCHNILYGSAVAAPQEEDNAAEMLHSDMERRLGQGRR